MPLITKLAKPAGAAIVALLAAGAPALAGGGPVAKFASCPGEVWSGEVGSYTFDFCFTNVTHEGGRAVARFNGELVPGSTPPAKAVSLRGFPCQAGFPARDVSTDSRLVVTPDGRVNGTCRS